ncbi:DUF3631 domain-containing protein [Elioraea sp.]|uniref:DUF3631 domain-containing protein n=1 Tax=Elioraea sp. TaxID=2185103 RepID=UPI003F6F8F1B
MDGEATPARISPEALLRDVGVAEELPATACASDIRAPDLKEEVTRLARLDSITYDHERKAAARRLGISRVSSLDDLVKKARKGQSQATDGVQGSPLEIKDREAWPEPVKAGELLGEVSDFLCRHVVMKPEEGDAIAVWCLCTYLSAAFDHAPKLHFTSPEKGSGKTTLLDLIQLVVQRPLLAGGITASALFRSIALARPTLLLDEADAVLRDNEDLRAILNVSHRRDGSVIRSVGDAHEPRVFPCYAFMAIAGIGTLPGTVADRSIAIRLHRAAPHERPARVMRATRHDGTGLGARLARVAHEIAPLLDEDPSLPGMLSNRAADNWRPLFAVALAIGGGWRERLTAAVRALSGQGHDATSAGVDLLADIRSLFVRSSDTRMTSEDICNGLAEMEDRPWPEWKAGRPITATQLARLLGPFGIRPTTVRATATRAKGYHRDAFEEAWQRYLPPSSRPEP